MNERQLGQLNPAARLLPKNQQKISAEVCLAQLPELRAVFLDRGESFDSDSLKELDKWATENDVLCITTIVDDIPDKMEAGVFYIQEGHLIGGKNE